MVIVTRVSQSPEAPIDVRLNFEREVEVDGKKETKIETVCRAFAPGDVHTLEDDAADKLKADPGIAAHFTFEKAEKKAPRPKADA